jgi:hypothetical protein
LVKNLKLKATLGSEIGKGKANTDLMLAFCSWGAGVRANAYRGGEKSDWYLPSTSELAEMYKYKQEYAKEVSSWIFLFESGFGGTGEYWSSTEIWHNSAETFYLDNGYASLGRWKDDKYLIRPVRAF